MPSFNLRVLVDLPAVFHSSVTSRVTLFVCNFMGPCAFGLSCQPGQRHSDHNAD